MIRTPDCQSRGWWFDSTSDVSNLRQLNVSFRRDTKICRSLLPGVCDRESKRSNAGKLKKPVVDSLTVKKENSEINHSYVSPRQGC